jgi:hypothetical protein
MTSAGWRKSEAVCARQHRRHIEEKSMELGLPASLDLRAVLLALVMLGAVVSALVFFLRQNRQDRDVLDEEIESARTEDEESTDDDQSAGRP